jgi:hypothetical protein
VLSRQDKLLQVARGRESCHAGPGAEPFDLHTARLAEQTPLTEVLAIVARESIVVFAQPRLGPGHDFARRIPGARMKSDLHRSTVSKVCEGQQLHWSALQSGEETAVVHDHAVADVDAVVLVAKAWSYQVSADWRVGIGCPVQRSCSCSMQVSFDSVLAIAFHSVSPVSTTAGETARA